MEIPEIIKSKALEASSTTTCHIELKSLLERLEKKTVQDFFKDDEDDEIFDIDNEVRELFIPVQYPNSIQTESDRIINLSQIIFTARSYLQIGISNADLKSILIFLSVNCYLKFGIDEFLSSEELEEKRTRAISDIISSVLEQVKFAPYVSANVRYYEKELLHLSEQGFANSSLKDAYSLIEAFEHSGRGLELNYLTRLLMSFLNSVSYLSCIKVFSKFNDLITIVFFVQVFKKEELLKITGESALTNKWLNFEIIRQIIDIQGKEEFGVSEVKAIKDGLSKIYTCDYDFFKQTINYLHGNKLLNASLGKLLTTLSNTKVEEILFDCLPIDRYKTNYLARKCLLEYFANNTNDDGFRFFITSIYKKWRLFFDDLFQQEDFFLNEILLTDYCDFVAEYHIHVTDELDIISQMQKLIYQIQFIDSEWSKSKSQQMTRFYFYHSELFLLTFAYKYKKINAEKIRDQYIALVEDGIYKSRFHTSESTDVFNQAIENLGWELINQSGNE